MGESEGEERYIHVNNIHFNPLMFFTSVTALACSQVIPRANCTYNLFVYLSTLHQPQAGTILATPLKKSRTPLSWALRRSHSSRKLQEPPVWGITATDRYRNLPPAHLVPRLRCLLPPCLGLAHQSTWNLHLWGACSFTSVQGLALLLPESPKEPV